MSDKDVMDKALRESASKYAPDPVENRGSARQEPGNLKMDLPPHMSDPSLGGGYVRDNVRETQAKNAQIDKNLSTVPPAKKP